MSKINITGIVLAGGKSSRMGTDKGMMMLNGKRFIDHIFNALVPVVDTVMIIANNDNYHRFNYPVYEDIIKDCGPMGGIYTGLVKSQTEKNIVVSCDIPFITTDTLSYIISRIDNSDIIIPEHEGKLEPLCAIYKKNVRKNLGNYLKRENGKCKKP